MIFGYNTPWSTWAVEPGIRRIEVEVSGRAYSLIEGAESVKEFGHWLWLGGVWLARELDCLDLRGKTVLDIGAGTGLIGIVAATMGAVVTWCDKYTGQRIYENASLNGVAGKIHPHGWDSLLGKWDWAFGGEAVPESKVMGMASNYILVDTDNLPGWTPLYLPAHGREVVYYTQHRQGGLSCPREHSFNPS